MSWSTYIPQPRDSLTSGDVNQYVGPDQLAIATRKWHLVYTGNANTYTLQGIS